MSAPTHSTIPERKDPERRRVSGPIARWRTDRNLVVVAASQAADAPLRALPAAGLAISRTRRRTGVLDLLAHRRALRGVACAYTLRLFGRAYRVELTPRRDRRRAVVGVSGLLRLETADAPRPRMDRRQQATYRSALRALQLAKTLSDDARAGAEALIAQARKRQEQARPDPRELEAQERRARLLTDAGALLEGSFDIDALRRRIAELIVERAADVCVMHVREGDRFRRVVLHAAHPSPLPALERAFPREEEVEAYRSALAGRAELFMQLLPAELAAVVPGRERGLALRRAGVLSVVRAPLRRHGTTCGLLTLASTQPAREYDLADLGLADNLAYRLSLAWQSSLLYEEAQAELIRRKEAEAKLQEFNAELERRVRERTVLLQEMTREANSFAYTVAHDLRAPLRAISGFCHMLQEDYGHAIDAVGRVYLDRVLQGAQRMDDLIFDLLEYARVNQTDLLRDRVDLDELAEELLRRMAPEIAERKADVRRVGELGAVVGHRPVILQVLANLVSNALKFVAPGVRPEVRIRGEAGAGRVRVVVEDNGIGIAPEYQDRIFGIFERLNRAEDYPGTGIGLAIVRRAVERMGGRVGVDSTVGQGSRFWVEFQAP
jgi:signal transduction histidine kinase